jgi:hypothetical protein
MTERLYSCRVNVYFVQGKLQITNMFIGCYQYFINSVMIYVPSSADALCFRPLHKCLGMCFTITVVQKRVRSFVTYLK